MIGERFATDKHDLVGDMASIVRRAGIPNVELVSEPEAAAAYIMRDAWQEIKKYDGRGVPNYLLDVRPIVVYQYCCLQADYESGSTHFSSLTWEAALRSAYAISK